MHGTGRPGKTEFPASWDEEDIAQALRAVATSPAVTHERPRGNWFADGQHRGVTIRAVVRSNGSIEAGWPLEGPGVKRNPR
ncbi:EndoU domain-containing protein [Natronoglycomyces albus]